MAGQGRVARLAGGRCIMRNTLLLHIAASSLASAVVTALVIVTVVPVAVDAQGSGSPAQA